MTDTPFDGIKALREEIQGLNDVKKTITKRVHNAERIMAEAEVEHNDTVKLLGFCNSEIDRKRKVLAQLEEQA